MTIQEMHTELELRLQKIGTYAVDNFLQEEYDAYLNDAQMRWIKSKFSAFSNMKQRGFEEVVKRLDDLRILHEPETTIESPIIMNGLYSFSLPADYLFFDAARLDSYSNPCGAASTSSSVTNGKVRVVETQAWADMRRNPYAKSKANSALAMIWGNGLVVDNDSSFIPKTLYLSYLRKAITMSYSGNVSCELPIHTHTEIVDIAVNLMIENIESPRIQSHGLVTNFND